jgi:hypothetical protein
MNEIELSPAELEMIKVKREQEILAKKELDAKKAIQLEKDIKLTEERIAAHRKKDESQINEATKYLHELLKHDPGYKSNIQVTTDTEKIYGEYLESTTKYEREILWSKEYERKNMCITYMGYKVTIYEHIAYGNGWKSRGTNKGYKMNISGPSMDFTQERRAYTRASKVHEVITNTIKSIESKKQLEEKKKDILTSTCEKIKELYPDATVTTGYDYERDFNRYKNSGARYDTITVLFTNKVQVTYKLYTDGSLGRMSTYLPTDTNQWNAMKTLSELKFE